MRHQKKKGEKTKAALRRIGMFYQKAPKEAMDQWRRWIGGDKSKFAKSCQDALTMYFAIEKAQKRSEHNNKVKAMKDISYDPDKIMTHVIEKMLRCANMMQFHLFSLWKNATFTDKEKRALMKKNR
jgi:hypothetical protein